MSPSVYLQTHVRVLLTKTTVGDFHQQLFSYLPFDELRVLTCGHVIPKDQLLVRTVRFIRLIPRQL